MEDIWLTRQNEQHPLTPQSLENHVYPFHTLPKVTSHLHPKFAIFMLGHLLNAAPGKARVAVYNHWPTTDKVMSIWAKWVKQVPPHAFSDPTYIDPNAQKEEEEEGMSILDGWESDGDSDCTRPRRIPYPPPKPPIRRPPPPQPPSIPASHCNPPESSASSHEEPLTPVDEGDSSWSHDQISEWARSCSTAASGGSGDIDIKVE
jgi:hypothetical protein